MLELVKCTSFSPLQPCAFCGRFYFLTSANCLWKLHDFCNIKAPNCCWTGHGSLNSSKATSSFLCENTRNSTFVQDKSMRVTTKWLEKLLFFLVSANCQLCIILLNIKSWLQAHSFSAGFQQEANLLTGCYHLQITIYKPHSCELDAACRTWVLPAISLFQPCLQCSELLFGCFRRGLRCSCDFLCVKEEVKHFLPLC